MPRRLSLHEREAVVACMLRERAWKWDHIAQVLKRDPEEVRRRVSDYREWIGRNEQLAQAMREIRA
jgi:hypothetical protein